MPGASSCRPPELSWSAFAKPVAVALLAGLAYLTIRKARSRFGRFAVRGDSMEPTFADGDFITALEVPGSLNLKPGALVVIRDPRGKGREMVKRVSEAMPNGDLVVVGDSPRQSTDSRHFGPVPRDLLIGRVVLRYWPLTRFRVFA